MSQRLHSELARLRRRCVLVHALPVLPWLAGLAIATQLGAAWLQWSVAVLGAAVAGWQIHRLARALRHRDLPWLLARLADLHPELEDSTDLLAAGADALPPLQQLQRSRVLARLPQRWSAALRMPLPWSGAARSAAIAGLLLGLAWLPGRQLPAPTGAPGSAVQAGQPAQVLDVRLTVNPPAYTGRPQQQVDQLAAQVAEASTLRWSLGFDLPPTGVELAFVDGSTLALREEQGRFVGERVIERSTLYRLRAIGAAAGDDALQRIDVISDRAPTLRVVAPERSLTLLDAAQRSWTLHIEGEDDYGLGAAELSLTLAQGSGEQVTISERRLRLPGSGDARRRSYRHVIDLAAIGYGRGDDLIARLQVGDNRQPGTQVSRTAALILRWPSPPMAAGSGVDGLVQRALPAYFRSQRQIIIDSEALIAERPALDPDTLVERSDAIGFDQRILRLRYGQFLGEETESGDLPGSGPTAGQDGDGHDHEDALHQPDDGHDHGDGSAPAAGFGEAGNLLAEVGHLHDIAEAATLLDPRTRSLLRDALSEMWQAEGRLRLGQPEAALPHEYRALERIKQVQQANRIYLARVGLELPAVDLSRRLSGEARPRQAPGDPLRAAQIAGPPLADWWRALDGRSELPLEPLAEWLASSPDLLGDPLGALAELDGLRRDPDCRDCRQRLQNALWPALPRATAAPLLRADGSASGRRYLELIHADDSAP